MSTDSIITFIGAGNMNSAIIGGLISSGYPASNIRVTDPHQEKLQTLTAKYHITSGSNNQTATKGADIIIIGVKPNHVVEVCQDIKQPTDDCVIISVAAGIGVQQIADNFPTTQAIIRVMPNTPCLYGAGTIGMYSNKYVTAEQLSIAKQIFTTTGHVEIIHDESQMDLVTALSGSGPAYFFYIAEALLAVANKQGMSSEQAKQLIYNTMSGAATMLQQSEYEPGQLRDNVTSPGGTTAAALGVLEQNEVATIFQQAIEAAVKRGKELAQ